MQNETLTESTPSDLRPDLGLDEALASGLLDDDLGLDLLAPDTTFYTYRITAEDSAKFYYGVSHVKHGGASIEECAAARYWGSGGVKFQHWRARHEGSLRKEVLATYPSALEAYKAEFALVGRQHLDNPLCLNSVPGGKISDFTLNPRRAEDFAIQECPEHGAVLHNGTSCCTCAVRSVTVMGVCDQHGKTWHRGPSCMKCMAGSSYATLMCEIHGETWHKGSYCTVCLANDSITTRSCEIHGETKFRGEVCCKCNVSTNYVTKECSRHGLVKHQGGSCMMCVNAAPITTQVCKKHGEVRHQSGKCMTCTAKSSVGMKTCEKHGLAKHKGDSCYRCAWEKRKG